MGSQAKVDPQIALRKIASSAAYLVLLDKIAGCGPQPRVEGQRAALCSLQFEADPVVTSTCLGAQNHRFAFQIFDHNLQAPIIEQIANCKPAAYLGNLYRRSGKLAYVTKGPVVLVEIEELRLAKFGADIFGIHLWVDMPVHDDEVCPAIVVQIEESVSPSHIRRGSAGDAGRIRDVSKAERAVVAVQGGILLTEVSDSDGEQALVLVVT